MAKLRNNNHGGWSSRACLLVLLLLVGVLAVFVNEWRSTSIKMTLSEGGLALGNSNEADFQGYAAPASLVKPEPPARPAAVPQEPAAAAAPVEEDPPQRPAAAAEPRTPPPPKACTIDCLPQCPMSSRPWAPCLRSAKVWPYRTETAWRSDFGERVMKAVTPQIVEEDCEGYELFGDHSFCLKAMRFNEPGSLALSYGIEERDQWSEKMSNRFGVSPRLYDCFIPPERSPPINGRAPNGTGPGSCKANDRICYEKPYQSFRICFGPSKATLDGREFETLHDHLVGRPPLSTYVKIDTEGSEWAVLDKLLETPADMDKIRTLDMEVHFLMGALSNRGEHVNSLSERDALEFEVNILERLNEHFRATGSTLEVYAQNWNPAKHCPRSDCNEPKIHTRGGFDLGQFAVSFVNRHIFDERAQTRTGPTGPLQRDAVASASRPQPQPFKMLNRAPEDPDPDEPIEVKGCKKKISGKSSRPGKPCLPPAEFYPYRSDTPWKSALGRRVWRTVTGYLTEEDCDGFEMFGDSTWCNRAMRNFPNDVLGLSYGIEQRDLWSEKMSNVFGMRTKLYDCFIPPHLSPPISGQAPNNTGKGGCQGESRHCYEQKYEPYRICLGPETTTVNNRPYEDLLSHLQPRGPLSTHVKIDTEGTEWAVLRDLLADPNAVGKVRTLEMEVHFSMTADAMPKDLRAMTLQQRLEVEVQILERLLDHFVITGSTLEVYREDRHPETQCPNANCAEPALHIPSMSVDQFAVSYVNKRLLKPETVERLEQRGAARQPAAPSRQRHDEDEEERPAREEERMPARERQDENRKPGEVEEEPGKLLGKPEGPDCDYECLPNCPASARPGTPCIPPAPVWPYQTNVPWRAVLGERIFKVVVGTVKEDECNGFHLFGDHVFCKKAMAKSQGMIALSYGIEERDMWSEKMGSLWRVPSRLYDCFQNPKSSPPLGGRAPNNQGPGGCSGIGEPCYETLYEPNRICLGPKRGKIEGRQYELLEDHLADRGPLTTYVKIDVEGSEWTVLERLLEMPDDIAKIRTLDMEVHFGFSAASDGANRRTTEKESLEREVVVMERLLEHFVCTGTTLENYRQGWQPEQNCPTKQCNEPAVHMRGGFGVIQFAVSYVNKQLLNRE